MGSGPVQGWSQEEPKWVILEAFWRPFWASPGQAKYGILMPGGIKWARTGPGLVPEWLQIGVQIGPFGPYLEAFWGLYGPVPRDLGCPEAKYGYMGYMGLDGLGP